VTICGEINESVEERQEEGEEGEEETYSSTFPFSFLALPPP
jgi:hypothetical protein